MLLFLLVFWVMLVLAIGILLHRRQPAGTFRPMANRTAGYSVNRHHVTDFHSLCATFPKAERGGSGHHA